jgi:ribonuclease III
MGDSLAEVSQILGVENFMYLSRGEERDTNSKARRYILANATEAIIGAIYLDLGWDAAKEFITNHVLVKLPEILEKRLYADPKSRFQEAAQSKLALTPTYKVLEETGPDHDKKFRMGIYLGKELIAEGAGTSKQEAQISAAEAGLKVKGW